MIRVSVKGTRENLRGFLIRGHAGFAEAGQDIVCAAVSALAATALLGLERYLPGKFGRAVSEEGLIFCKLHPDLTERETHDAQVILTVLLLGLEGVAEEYGRYIELALQEVKHHDEDESAAVRS